MKPSIRIHEADAEARQELGIHDLNYGQPEI